MAQFFGRDTLQRRHKIYTRVVKVGRKIIGYRAEVYRYEPNGLTTDLTKLIPGLENPIVGSETSCWLDATELTIKAYDSGLIDDGL